MRQIYTVHATQVATSAQNPQGVLSDVPNFPKKFDSRDYKATAQNPNGDEEIALLAAQAEYSGEIKTLATADSPNRVGWSVSITRWSDGKQLYLKSFGGFPDMTPQPEPTPEPAEEAE